MAEKPTHDLDSQRGFARLSSEVFEAMALNESGLGEASAGID